MLSVLKEEVSNEWVIHSDKYDTLVYTPAGDIMTFASDIEAQHWIDEHPYWEAFEDLAASVFDDEAAWYPTPQIDPHEIN